MNKKISIIGLPGSGKTTLGKNLSTKLSIPHYSLGDLVRQHLADQTPLGQKIREFISQQKGWSPLRDDLAEAVMSDQLSNQEAWIIDGFPRNIIQAQSDLLKDLDHYLLVDIDPEIALQRVLTRQRVDDSVDKFQARLKAEAERLPELINHAKQQGKLIQLNGENNSEILFQEATNLLSTKKAPTKLKLLTSEHDHFQFEAGKPACPVSCKYCFITEHDERREVWNKNPQAGLNKASTFINVPPWIDQSEAEQKRFRSFPWEILRGDIVGFTAITDPFWPKIEKFFWEFIEKTSPLAKLVTAVTKWPLSKSTLKRLATIPNFRLVLAITGNRPPIEKVSVEKHLETLALAQEYGVKTLPISHPYISGVSDLSFLPDLKKLGYQNFDVKGFRYCDSQMGSWMPESSKHFYLGQEDQEILPEDGWREKVEAAGLELLSPRQWYLRESKDLQPKLTSEQASEYVDKVMELSNIVSSSSNQDVIEAAIKRRM